VTTDDRSQSLHSLKTLLGINLPEYLKLVSRSQPQTFYTSLRPYVRKLDIHLPLFARQNNRHASLNPTLIAFRSGPPNNLSTSLFLFCKRVSGPAGKLYSIILYSVPTPYSVQLSRNDTLPSTAIPIDRPSRNATMQGQTPSHSLDASSSDVLLLPKTYSVVLQRQLSFSNTLFFVFGQLSLIHASLRSSTRGIMMPMDTSIFVSLLFHQPSLIMSICGPYTLLLTKSLV
jgi:hypothetical protein